MLFFGAYNIFHEISPSAAWKAILGHVCMWGRSLLIIRATSNVKFVELERSPTERVKQIPVTDGNW